MWWGMSTKMLQEGAAPRERPPSWQRRRALTAPPPSPLPAPPAVEWPNFENANDHPLHLHVNPFQLVELSGPAFLAPGVNYTSWFREGDWQDTISLPFTQASADGTSPGIKIRMQPGKYTGYSVMHCHSLHHEDEGCMKVVAWTCPGYKPGAAQPAQCAGFTPPVPGTFQIREAPASPAVAPAAAPAAAPSSGSCTARTAAVVVAAVAAASL